MLTPFWDFVGTHEAPDWLDVAAVRALFDKEQGRARRAYGQFIAEGIHQASPWDRVTGQVFLGGPDFLERVEWLMRGEPLVNVPTTQTKPTRLSPDEVLQHVASTYRLPVNDVLARSHRDAYQTAVYLLRRAENEPLQSVAVRFRISPSRISQIQRAIESAPLTPFQVRAFATCKVKN